MAVLSSHPKILEMRRMSQHKRSGKKHKELQEQWLCGGGSILNTTMHNMFNRLDTECWRAFIDPTNVGKSVPAQVSQAVWGPVEHSIKVGTGRCYITVCQTPLTGV